MVLTPGLPQIHKAPLALLALLALSACSDPVEVDGPTGLVGAWRATEWVVTNTEQLSESIDGLRFFENWELTLAADSTYTASFKVVNQGGLISESGSFSETAGQIEFRTSQPLGQLSISGRTLSFRLSDGALVLAGRSTLSWQVGQAFGFTPRTVAFLNYTTDNVITLARR